MTSLQRGDASARDAAGKQDALARPSSHGRAPISDAACTSRRRSGSSSSRGLRLADDETMAIETLHVREPLVPGPRPAGLRRARPFYDLLAEPLRDRDRRRHPDDRADGDERGGVRPIARRAAPLARLPVRAHDALRVGDYRRVRALDLPRRSLPPRHRAEPSRPLGVPAPVFVLRDAVMSALLRSRTAPPGPGALLLNRSASSRPRLRAAARARPTNTRPSAAGRPHRGLEPRAHGRARVVGQRRFLRRLRIRLAAALDGDCATRSRSVYYGAEIDLRGSCIAGAVAVGPDPRRARRMSSARGRAERSRSAITNETESALGELAGGRRVCRSRQGPERSIAATKTYTAPGCARWRSGGPRARAGVR